MKKIELKSMAEYFGNFIPAGKIQNRDARLAVVMLYGSLAKPAKEIGDEVEAVRVALTKDHEEELQKYSTLIQKSFNKELSEDERNKAKEEAEAMTECVKIDKDFQEATGKIYDEDIDVPIKKISLELLFDALSDCGFPRFDPNLSIAAVEEIFKVVLA